MNIDPKSALQQSETLMLDMDGTVLDLAYDNYVWKELVPERYAEHRGISLETARDRLFAKYEAIQGDIQWYCLDHWSERGENRWRRHHGHYLDRPDRRRQVSPVRTSPAPVPPWGTDRP